ncbi:hypothetical protein JS528_03250 [Bifidobacterium sp. MA2]|uniref:Uncharacterized protein n=1 Tax=Bifidobacterium santillanense TaxID=2809028 RepID=A0ABS5UND8_9BIFI|nr:hypothetical protein [Bifidobacterium santillanense]MBT1172394.1 hypothetical protein [Bifidobacterium santillanense]
MPVCGGMMDLVDAISNLLPWFVPCGFAAVALAALFRRLLRCGWISAGALGSAPVLGWSAMLLLDLSVVTADYPSISAQHPNGCDGWLHPCGVGPGPLSGMLFAGAGLCALATVVILLIDVLMLIVGVVSLVFDWASDRRDRPSGRGRSG